jgi:hypothetical protein
MKIKNARDFWAGLMFVGFGAAFVAIAQNYNMGTAVRMGPAYFPTMLGGILVVLGSVIFVRSFLSKVENGALPPFFIKPLLIILGSVCLFGVLLKPLGLVLATLALIVVSAWGGNDFRWKEVVILYIVLILGSVGMFYYGLGLPFNLWPELGN